MTDKLSNKFDDLSIRKSMIEDYEFCPLRFKKTWLRDTPLNRRAYIMDVGTRFHDFAAKFFDYCFALDPEDWDEMIHPDFAPMEVNMLKWFIEMERRRYYDHEKRGELDTWMPVQRELKMSVPAMGISGTMDRIDWACKEKNELAIIEYKTGFSFYQPSLIRQMAYYSILWEESVHDGQVTQMIVINPRLEKIVPFDLVPSQTSKVVEKIVELRMRIRMDGPWKKKCSPAKFAMCGMCTICESGLYKRVCDEEDAERVMEDETND